MYVKDGLEVLGMETVRAQNRKLSKKEEKRLKAARDALKVLRCLPISNKLKTVAVRALRLAKLTYGWMGKNVAENRS